MNTPLEPEVPGRPGPDHPGRPRVRVALRSSRRTAEIRIQVNWRCRVSALGAARLLIVLALVLGAAAVALPGGGALARGALCSYAGFLAGSRPRIRR
jgi:hypothetical protein